MKVLVTGSSGHLGEALVRTLSLSGHAVVGVDAVLHAAPLHKPHVTTHGRQDFVDTNVTGTLNLLEEAAAAKVRAFVFTSTTSTFGDALTPAAGEPTAWITEAVRPIPKNIYGVTKTAAEDLCRLFSRNHGLPCLVLRTSRFFPEADDDDGTRRAFDDANLKANEFLHRRVDLTDVVSAHLLAIERAAELAFDTFIVSATTPFTQADLPELRTNAPAVIRRRVPRFEAVYDAMGWSAPPGIDRVYVNQRARTRLGWVPQVDFERILGHLDRGEDPRSELARAVGAKGYHGRQSLSGVPYRVE